MSKKTYIVAPGVAWMNGAPVPRDRKIELTEQEAQYDLGLGRIELAKAEPAKPEK